MLHVLYPVEKQKPIPVKWGGYANALYDYINTLSRKASKIVEKTPKDKLIYVDKIMDKLDKEMREEVKKLKERISKAVNENITDGVKSARQKLDRAKKQDPTRLAAEFASTYNFSLIKNIDDDLRHDIRQTIVNGILENKHNSYIARDLRELPIQPIPAGRRILTPNERAELIARTETMRAFNIGNMIEYIQSGVEMVDIVTAYDEKTCEECISIADEGPYPVDSAPLPPYHPNCRCEPVPASPPGSEPSSDESESMVNNLMGMAFGVILDMGINEFTNGLLGNW